LGGVVASDALGRPCCIRWRVLTRGPRLFPLFHRVRRVAEDLEPHHGVRERRPVVHVPRDPWRQRGLDEPGQQLRHLSQPIELLPRDRQHAEGDAIRA
jgi:hypothetical protein